MLCPCQSGLSYRQCCHLFHQGKAAPTAEALMRSRYSAYVQGNANYLHRTWHKLTRPSKKILLQDSPAEWLGLEIVRSERGTALDREGVVEFIARYHDGKAVAQLHETSRFVRENGRWVYLDGDYLTPPGG